MRGELKIFSGNGNPDLAQEICEYIGVPLGQSMIRRFSNENLFIQIMETGR